MTTIFNIVIRQSAAILKLLSSKDQTLLIRGDSLLILNLGLDVVNGVRGLDIKSDGLSGKGLDEDLHTTSKSEDQMESGLFLDVVIRESTAIFELLTSENKSLLIWWNTFLILNLGPIGSKAKRA